MRSVLFANCPESPSPSGPLQFVRETVFVNSTWNDCKYKLKGRYNATSSSCRVFDALEEVCIKVLRSPGGKWLGSDAMGGLGCHVANYWQPMLWRRLPPEEDAAAAPLATDLSPLADELPFLIPPGPFPAAQYKVIHTNLVYDSEPSSA